MTTSPDIDYAGQSRWSDPEPYGAALETAKSSPAELPDRVSGLILHPGLARMRGFAVPPGAEHDQDLRSLAEMLDVLTTRNVAPLSAKRSPEDRLFGVCRHYALMAAALLRADGVPARLRAGFATYFTPGWAEDHWVCEYRDGTSWKLLDAELGDTTRRQLRIAFAPHDVPRDRFISAAQIWRGVRCGDLDADKVGLRELGIRGLWFVAGSLLRDLAALTMDELQPWDVWGPTRNLEQDQPIDPEWLVRFDDLAAALSTEPQSLSDARRLAQTYAWATPGATILSYRLEPIEVSLT